MRFETQKAIEDTLLSIINDFDNPDELTYGNVEGNINQLRKVVVILQNIPMWNKIDPEDLRVFLKENA